jgi:hypothetical protein
LALHLLSAARQGTRIVLSYRVDSTLQRDVRIVAVTATPGLEAGAPVTVIPPWPRTPSGTRLDVRVSVRDCPSATSLYSTEHARMRFQEAVWPFALELRGLNAGRTVEPSPDGMTLAYIRALVARRCP